MPVTKKDLEERINALEADVNERINKYSTRLADMDSALIRQDKDIDDFRDEIENVDSRCDDIEGQAGENENAIDDLKSKIETIESDVSDIILIEGE